MEGLKQVVDAYLAAMRGRYPDLPRRYLVIDLETTGVDLRSDLIVQIGHCLVDGGQPVDTAAFVLDWAAAGKVTAEWLAERLARTRRYVEEDSAGRPTGRRYRFTPERLRQEGADPLAILAFYASWLEDLRQEGVFLVAHNGYHFDCALLERHFQRLLQKPYQFAADEVCDTGMLVKAAQAGLSFWPGDTPQSFSQRVYRERLKGVRWALDSFCVPYFQLDRKYGLRADDAHEADWDVHVTHLLFQECLARAGFLAPVSS